MEITQHGDGQLPSFAIPLDVAGTSPTLEEIRHLQGQDVAANDLLDLQTGLWPVNGGQGRGGYVLHGPENALGERVLFGQTLDEESISWRASELL